MNRPFSRRRLLAAAVVTIALPATGCAGDPIPTPPPPPPPPPPDDVIRVGSANFAENRLLAELYATGLQRRNVPVERRFSVGTRENYLPALQDGSIDLIPEYTGNLLLFLDPGATAATPDQVFQALSPILPESVQLLTMADAQNKDAVVVTDAFQKQHNLQTIDDLAPLCSSITLGGPPEFDKRPYGTPGLASNYECALGGFQPLDVGGPQTVAALRDGKVQAADLFTTDPAIPTNNFFVLQDPRSNFRAQNVAPLIDAEKGKDARVTEVLDQISAALTTPVLSELNRRVAGNDNGNGKPDPARVAGDWLTSIGIPPAPK